jgi:DNA-binding NarL/FixJ family response regulator
MSHKYAIVKDNVVQNLVQWDGVSEFNVDGELIEASNDAWIGGSYTDGAFVPRPVEPAPEPTAEELQAQADRQSAIDKLTALGLTEQEIAALGIN